jgi:hypothetical protein
MTEKQKVSPGDALARLFDVIREEALANPRFAQRMLSAVGCQVVFVGDDAAKTADPILLAGSGDFAAFYETFSSFSEKDLKAMIGTFALGTAEAVKSIKGKAKKAAYIDLMWAGAQAKLRDRRA